MSEQQTLKFTIKNKSLFEHLTNLGIQFEDTKEGEFSDAMRIVLPSGENAEIVGEENWSLPYVDACPSISAWIVAALLWEVEDVYPAKKVDEYSDFAKELIALLNSAKITHLDWEAVEHWSRDGMIGDLSAAFDQMDSCIEEAEIEHAYGFEGKVEPCIYTEVHNGQRMSVHYSNQKGIETEDCEGLKFVVAGNLKYFENREAIIEAIEEKGGSVSDSVSKNTDYLICNDIRSSSTKMKKAKSFGISVLTELAFIRRFCDPYEFDDIKDEDEVSEDAWGMTYDGKVLDFVVENGTQPIVMEVWKDGKWQRGVSKQKTASKVAALSAECEEAKNIASLIFAGEYGSLLRKLLLIKTRDCLTTEDCSLVESADVSFDEMCTRGFIRFEPRPIRISPQEEQGCFINVEKEKEEYGSSLLNFTIICNPCICDLDGYKSRTLEMSSFIVDSINGKELDGFGKIHLMSCSSRALSDVHVCSSLTFTVGENMLFEEQPDANVIKGYDIDNTTIAGALLEIPSLRRMMELENASDEDAYTDSHFRASQALAPIDGKSYTSWLAFNWDFSMGASMTIETSLTIAPVSRDRKLLADILSVIKEKLPSLSLPVRGELIYSKDNSEDEIKLADVYCGLIVFK